MTISITTVSITILSIMTVSMVVYLWHSALTAQSINDTHHNSIECRCAQWNYGECRVFLNCDAECRYGALFCPSLRPTSPAREGPETLSIMTLSININKTRHSALWEIIVMLNPSYVDFFVNNAGCHILSLLCWLLCWMSLCWVYPWPLLELKTLPKVCPASLGLSFILG
jgi:hypothetical protein